MKTVIHGIHHLPEADYRALDAINKTGLDYIAKSPAHFQAFRAQPPEATDAMLLGMATHLGVFEPELLYKKFFARPDGIDGRTKEGKAALREIGIKNAGKTMLRSEEFATIEGIMKSIRGHALASQLISGGRAEAAAISQDPEHGVLCKARPDYLRADDMIIDLKTTGNAGFFQFQRSVRDFRYHVQAAWYLKVVNEALKRSQYKRFVLMVVEKEPPFGVILYELDAEALRIGATVARQNLKTYAECLKRNEWPGYPETVLTMTVPVYE